MLGYFPHVSLLQCALVLTGDVGSGPVKGKHVILVDEMCDSGRTMACLKALMESRDAKSVRSCVMFDKQARRICNIECGVYSVASGSSL